jgi:hypothetical protein
LQKIAKRMFAPRLLRRMFGHLKRYHNYSKLGRRLREADKYVCWPFGASWRRGLLATIVPLGVAALCVSHGLPWIDGALCAAPPLPPTRVAWLC